MDVILISILFSWMGMDIIYEYPSPSESIIDFNILKIQKIKSVHFEGEGD